MPESERPRSPADIAPAVAPRMMSGQFPDEILDPAIREIEQQYGVVLDRDALRARLEQEIGFADYGKYAREQFLEGLRLIEKEGLRISTDKGIFLPADLAERVRRRFPEPGPQTQAPGGSLSSLASILENMPGTVAPDSTTSPDATVSPQLTKAGSPTPPFPTLKSLTRLPPALSARVHALLSSQRDPTSPSPTA